MTAFSLESYSFLQQDTADRSVKVLEQISLQLSSFSTNAVFINSTIPTLPRSNFSASTTDITINVLWFLSLTLALMAALFALLAQQWIRQYADLPLVTGQKRAQVRQRRFEALDRWCVPQIIVGLGLLLQAALFLFFGGLIVLLWRTNPIVAKATTSTVAFFITAFLLTAVLPVLSADCPYKSPLASGIRRPINFALYPLFVSSIIVVAFWDVCFHFNGSGWLSKSIDRMSDRCSGNWHTTEEKTFETIDKALLDCRSISWATQTATSVSFGNLLALLKSKSPCEALITWLANCVKYTPEETLEAIRDKTLQRYPIRRDHIGTSVVSALILHASAELEHALDDRATTVAENAAKETMDIINVILWINNLDFPSEICYAESWSYLSTTVKAFDVFGHKRHLVPMLRRMVQTCQNRDMESDPLDPAWCKSKSRLMVQKKLILIYLFVVCLSSVATSNWFWDLYHALDLPILDQTSEPGHQTSEPGQAVNKLQTTLTAAFELVAIASIEEVRRGYILDAPAHSILHSPSGQEERKRRWVAIKGYFQHPGIQYHRNDGDDRHWFKALDELLEFVSYANNQLGPTANPATITHDELSELVDSCMVGGILKETDIPFLCPYLEEFLRSANTSRREDV